LTTGCETIGGGKGQEGKQKIPGLEYETKSRDLRGSAEGQNPGGRSLRGGKRRGKGPAALKGGEVTLTLGGNKVGPRK